MKTEELFLKLFSCPLMNAVLKKYPAGNIMQYWMENPILYQSFENSLGISSTELEQTASGHTGIDIATYHGDLIVAPCDMDIVNVVVDNPTKLGGNYIYAMSEPFIMSNGFPAQYSIYFGHCATIYVKPGQHIAKGNAIATEGNSGFVVSGNVQYWNNAPTGIGTHLHFQMVKHFYHGEVMYPDKVSRGTVDPLPLIMFMNPNYSGTITLLTNLASYLRRKLAGLR